MKKFFLENNLTAPFIVLGLFLLILGFMFVGVANNFANKSDSITVTGTSERMVTSDTAKLIVTLAAKSMGVNSKSESEKTLQNNLKTLKSYLNKNGIKDEDVTQLPSTSYPICNLSVQGYENCALGEIGTNATLILNVDSSDVNAITDISKKINLELANLNLNQAVEYYYNNLKNIRAEMLSEATKNAKERAESVAKAGGASIGNITSLSSGVFQVTSVNSVSFDDYGAYDTSSLEKKITATVKANFSVK